MRSSTSRTAASTSRRTGRRRPSSGARRRTRTRPRCSCCSTKSQRGSSGARAPSCARARATLPPAVTAREHEKYLCMVEDRAEGRCHAMRWSEGIAYGFSCCLGHCEMSIGIPRMSTALCECVHVVRASRSVPRPSLAESRYAGGYSRPAAGDPGTVSPRGSSLVRWSCFSSPCAPCSGTCRLRCAWVCVRLASSLGLWCAVVVHSIGVIYAYRLLCACIARISRLRETTSAQYSHHQWFPCVPSLFL